MLFEMLVLFGWSNTVQTPLEQDSTMMGSGGVHELLQNKATVGFICTLEGSLDLRDGTGGPRTTLS